MNSSKKTRWIHLYSEILGLINISVECYFIITNKISGMEVKDVTPLITLLE